MGVAAQKVNQNLPNLGYKQIAERLGCSERTVKFHKARIAEKLGVKTSAEIALRLSSTAKNK